MTRRSCAWCTTAPSWTDAVEDRATALVHAVEGGCLLGDTDDEIEANCAELAAAASAT